MRGQVLRHHDVAVYCDITDSEHRRLLLERVTAALDQIYRLDQRRIGRLVRDGVPIVIVALQGRHFFSEVVDAICLDRRILSREASNTSTIACAIVHESTHARMAHAGLFYSKRYAARMERRCIEEEIAYLGRSPYIKPDEFAAWAASRRKALDHPWWTRRGRLEAYAKFLETEGAPAWIPRLVRIRARFTFDSLGPGLWRPRS